MIVESFKKVTLKELYKKYDTEGRLLPDGVRYIDSWITADHSRCFQLMEASSEDQIRNWINEWNSLADFEFYEVINSDSARRSILKQNPAE